ncbi:MAG TPA: nuclear transport factor 2 family protein [Terriglobales bacterium]|nr:nuclear transport factor 2 family protein [Terriglobales bacterium]
MNRFRFTTGTLVVLACVSFAWVRGIRPAAAAGPPSVDAKPLSPLEEQLISYEKAMPEAEKKHDIDFYKHTLTDDFVAVGTDAKIHDKNEILEDLRATELVEYRPYGIQVVQLNEGAAVVTYDVIIRMARYDEDIPRYQHISSVWVKLGEQWKLRFQQATAAQ